MAKDKTPTIEERVAELEAKVDLLMHHTGHAVPVQNADTPKPPPTEPPDS